MKKITSVLLAITMLFSLTATVSAESEKSGFTDIEDVRRTINEIYDENSNVTIEKINMKSVYKMDENVVSDEVTKS